MHHPQRLLGTLLVAALPASTLHMQPTRYPLDVTNSAQEREALRVEVVKSDVNTSAPCDTFCIVLRYVLDRRGHEFAAVKSQPDGSRDTSFDMRWRVNVSLPGSRDCYVATHKTIGDTYYGCEFVTEGANGDLYVELSRGIIHAVPTWQQHDMGVGLICDGPSGDGWIDLDRSIPGRILISIRAS
jgi:hypothetical protein